MAQAKVVSVLNRFKDTNGNWVVTLPKNRTADVYTNIETGETLDDLLTQMTAALGGGTASIIEDLVSVMSQMVGFMDSNMNLNHIYRENFRTASNINVLSGLWEEGSVRSSTSGNLEFQLARPIDLVGEPSKIKFDWFMLYKGTPNMEVQMTVNAKDPSPTWFNVTDVFMSKEYYNIIDLPSKDPSKPYSINVRIVGTVGPTEFIEFSDLTVVHL